VNQQTELTRPDRQAVRPGLDVERVRRDFPAIHQEVHGHPLVYLDSAATALKPHAVIEAVVHAYSRDCANIHRGVHLLSQRATVAYEESRETVRDFIGARSEKEVIFVRGTTEALNLLASTLGRSRLGAGDRVLLTGLEHHSNIVPWQLACAAAGAELDVVPVTSKGEVLLEAFAERLTPRTRIASFAHVSNALGTVLPVAEMARVAHEHGALVVVDGAQAAPHLPIDVKSLGVDFYAFSGHKLYGPTGTGVLYGREDLLETLPPYQGGGDMIRSVTFEKTTYNDLPFRFEAGTPDIAGVVGLGAAIRYLNGLGVAPRMAHEADLLQRGTEILSSIPGVTLVGTAEKKIGVLSFVVDDVHPHDLGTILDAEGVAIRTGHHCAQPLMDRFGLPATARASLGVYNDTEDLERLGQAVRKAQEMFAR
jgi:cysteine desulfurase/selenocysteine lyase